MTGRPTWMPPLLIWAARQTALAAADMELWLKNLSAVHDSQGGNFGGCIIAPKALKEIDDIVSKSSPQARRSMAFDQAASGKQVAGRIDGFATTPFIEKEFEVTAGDFTVKAIEAELQSLRRFAKPETAADLGNNLEGPD